MSTARVIGVDPGPTPGVVVLEIVDGALVCAEALQCSHGLLMHTLWGLHWSRAPGAGTVLAAERFVTKGRLNHAQSLTRDQVAGLAMAYPALQLRAAVEVKPWATDDRLARAGLLEPTKGMRHARDAARHALYAAVRAQLLPDPLSKEWSR